VWQEKCAEPQCGAASCRFARWRLWTFVVQCVLLGFELVFDTTHLDLFLDELPDQTESRSKIDTSTSHRATWPRQRGFAIALASVAIP
jgi:hypothetical protein